MFAIYFRGLLKPSLNIKLFGYPHIVVPQIPICLEFFSSDARDDSDSFTVRYLIHKCGLSPEDAQLAAKKTNLKSPTKPDSVVSCLKNHGFTKAHITKLVMRRPDILKADPRRTLLPKIKFFLSIGIPATQFAGASSAYPDLLRVSLEKSLIPAYNYLKSFVHTDEKVVYVFKRSARIFATGWRREIPVNIATLREFSVSESFISFMVAYHPSALMRRPDLFVKHLNQVLEMGFSSSKLTFVIALQTICDINQSTLERKKKVYQRWGFSESDIKLAFLVQPICMSLSESKIDSAMDFLVNEIGCEPRAIAKCPMLLFFNLEKRIMPRCQVARALILKGLKKKTTHVSSLVLVSNEKFLKRYVTKYLEDIPQLLNLYQGKLEITDLGFSLEEVNQVKLQ